MRDKQYVEDVYNADGELVSEGYATWQCDCGQPVYRYRGQGDVTCPNGHYFNAFGQRLRDDFMDNPAWKYPDLEIDDCEGYELQQLAKEQG